MAIKSSNQITFTEHKKIVEINEWYLATSQDTGVTVETSGWTKRPQAINNTNKYLWNYEEVVYSLGSSELREPVIIGVYGGTGASLQVKYISSTEFPTIIDNDVSQWSDTVPTIEAGKNTYMTQKLSTSKNWSIPIKISAQDGAEPTIKIVNGYWYINDESTDVKAEGEAPQITIGSNGNWFVNGNDTGTKAQGEAGKDGVNIEYVYYRSQTAKTNLTKPSYNADGKLSSGWTASPSGITETYKYEYVSVRSKSPEGVWSEFSAPVIWSKWGEKGQDGDGIEYRYYVSNSNIAPTYTEDDPMWTDDPNGVSEDNQYEYVVQLKISNGTVTPSTPSLWAKYGEDGVGIQSIKNYYAITSTPELTTSDEWGTTVPALTPENKFLWNKEVITYTSGDSTETDPAIIGVYGDSGTNAITFEIYSTQGFIFKQNLNSIELKIAAFEGGEVITGATYQWQHANGDGESYTDIKDATKDSLTVSSTDPYATTSLRCVMTYNKKTYIDYVMLTKEVEVYTASVNFFDGSNIFAANDLYLVAYIDVYLNGKIDESLLADKYCTGVSSINSSNVITPSVDNLTGENQSKMYFICRVNNKLQAVLGEYNSSTKQWQKSTKTTKYQYTSVYYSSDTNVFVISKEEVNKSENIKFKIYKNREEITSANAMVIDSNDPIISNDEPQNPVNNQLWLDTSTNPSILKIYSEDKQDWLECAQQSGNSIYTIKPTSYLAGDLWILSANNECGEFGAGTMLKAIQDSNGSFDPTHWIDADAEITNLKKNIYQYFKFDQNSGLKIGQTDEKFYVNINSTEMGFYDNSEGQNQKVVSISNNQATIQNATFEGSHGTYFDNMAVFMQQVRFGPFVWQVEDNGSLSLIADSAYSII